ncbi:TonB-dependent receptor [Flavobacterium akiainvivens]|uniref:TonB-dependent receptor n=1 Tax=Flavobacterium akiainvivens TaxID=1202724 RepID=A0A0M8MJM3_9FLAO|nr:carboxypeptidase regulatory-like domain-containing protein [Flavobacterium akiainvivens]KOS06908.1 TonB-dependent receptor [Flavobacterium akiainvivens]SFQ69731.1 CarboxypepD_reg-like domain-containing protein [Flavobacterium akiainvivens]
MKKLVLSLLFAVQAVCAFAQQTASVTAKVVDSKSQKPLQNVTATLEGNAATVQTNAEGVFVFASVAPGSHEVTISTTGYVAQTFTIEVQEGQALDLGVVNFEEDITTEQQLSLITITDNDLGDDNSGSENTAGLLQASRDTYQQAAAFNWGMARYRVRGLDNEYGTTMINGVTMNKLYDGRPQWSNWGGLNDATRNQEFTMGSAPSDYTFGNILGTQEINTRASIYRPGARVSFSGANTSYDWRMMATYASGLQADGWAYTISASRRWAQEGYFEGSDYSANSFFASVEKKINDKHSLNFTSIYAQNSRGKNSPNTQEVINLRGEDYNSYWGWQNGKKRNSRDKDVEEPIFMLSHYWTISDKTSLNTNVAYQFGSIGNTRLDFQDVKNPDPTYYGNLPSYYLSFYENQNVAPEQFLPGGLGGNFVGNSPENLALAQSNLNSFMANPQINWDYMYQVNTVPVTDANNQEIGRAPGVSKYVLYEDRTDDKTFTANTILRSQLADNIILNAGATYRNLKSHNFQNLLDLMGGAYYMDIDPFFAGSQGQSDLNNPGRQVGVGDTFGYNYNLLANTIDAFAQFKFSYSKVDFYGALNYSRSEYQRDGLYRNGIYPTNSFGKSQKVSFDNPGAKAGITYKIDGRNSIVANGIYMSKAPTLRNTFPNARLNNNIVDGIDSEDIMGGDISYVVRAPRLKARLTGFYNLIQNATETSFFFAEGVVEGETTGDTNAFIAETVTDIDKKMMGGELGLEYQVTSTIKVMASAAYGQYTYDNNPNVFINNDAFASDELGVGGQAAILNYGPAALKDYKLPGMPQQAYSIGLEYRDPKYWWIGANANYLANNYIDVSALLRTSNFLTDNTLGIGYPEATESRTRELLKQERFDEIYLVNLQGGKSWKVKQNIIGFFASVNNVFDVRYKTGGFEQARNASYRTLNQDVSSGNPSFGPRYFYGYGRTFFVNLYINF